MTRTPRIFALALIALVLTAGAALTSSDAAEARPGGRAVALAGHAVEVAPGVFSLGRDDRGAQGFAIVHYRTGHSHRPGHSGGRPGGSSGPACYGFLASGARWKTTEPYVLDPSNADGLAEAFVAEQTAAGLETWDGQVAFDVFGGRDTGQTVDGADTAAPDGKNEVYFGEIADSGAIAVTIVWGYFSGPPRFRELIEFDMIFDDADYTWGDATVNANVMDYRNIAVHEIGHGAGLADIYDSACSEVTMYGYGTVGETKKRTLETPDVTGIQSLYQ